LELVERYLSTKIDVKNSTKMNYGFVKNILNKVNRMVDGYSGFLFLDDDGMPLVAMHWEHRFNRMVGRYNDI